MSFRLRWASTRLDLSDENNYHLSMSQEILAPNNLRLSPLLPGEAGTGSPRRMTSAELFGTTREIIIEHEGSEYRLRVTSNDKLILTK